MQGLTESQRAIFNVEFDRVAKKRNTILWLTLLLGGLGAHHFYLERKGLGILYLLFRWTFIPLIVAFFELFVVTVSTGLTTSAPKKLSTSYVCPGDRWILLIPKAIVQRSHNLAAHS